MPEKSGKKTIQPKNNSTMKDTEKHFIKNFERYKASFVKLATLAKQYNVSRATIYNWVEKHYPEYEPQNHRRKIVLALLKAGFTTTQATAFTKTTRTQVLRIISETKQKAIQGDMNNQPQSKKITKTAAYRSVNINIMEL